MDWALRYESSQHRKRSKPMTTSRTEDSISRRTALAGIGATGLSLALAANTRQASAQEATPDALASHPIVGVWNSITPGGPALGLFLPDGTNIVGIPATQAGAQGVEFVGTQIGRWEPVSERGIHFTSVQFHSDANGTFTGSVTVDGYPVVSEDGQTLIDDQSQVMITIRDATGAIVQQVPGAGSPPVTGTKMGVGSPGFPEVTPSATPTS
jgi:hypothetical protein